MPQHFLVPVDFSPDSDHALDYAIDLATKLQAHLTLVHVVHMLRMTEVDLTPYIKQVEAESYKRLEACLQRVHDAGLEGHILMQHGIPSQEIISTAREVGADLLVIGTHGRTGLEHLLIGSVAEKVVRLSSCPVLVTRRPKEASAA